MKLFYNLFVCLFKPGNICKIFTIFILGFFSRYFINDLFDINVFKDYTNYISLTYYFSFSCFVVYIIQLFDSFIAYSFSDVFSFSSLYFKNSLNNIVYFIVCCYNFIYRMVQQEFLTLNANPYNKSICQNTNKDFGVNNSAGNSVIRNKIGSRSAPSPASGPGSVPTSASNPPSASNPSSALNPTSRFGSSNSSNSYYGNNPLVPENVARKHKLVSKPNLQ